ncbi:MAG: sigma-70 family RNA polymerase sigma factor [Planctomycetota bacterium]|nr:sigma-70 family RNA polymerase sigma factor [Planctomycetota bacterium]
MDDPEPLRQIAAPTAKQVFEILVRENADMLTAFLRSLVRRGPSIDDLFQQTMLVAWRRLGEYDPTRPFGPWLRGIAARLVMEHHRRLGRGGVACEAEVLEALHTKFEGVRSLPGDSFRERVSRVSDCLEKLPEQFREALELAYVRGLLLREIAGAVQASEEAVKKRVQRGRLMLAACMEQNANASGPEATASG